MFFMCPMPARWCGTTAARLFLGGPGRCRGLGTLGTGCRAFCALVGEEEPGHRSSSYHGTITATVSLDRPAKDINQGTKGVFVVGSRESVRRGRAAGSCQVDRV